jgi:hypothetical protein
MPDSIFLNHEPPKPKMSQPTTQGSQLTNGYAFPVSSVSGGPLQEINLSNNQY